MIPPNTRPTKAFPRRQPQTSQEIIDSNIYLPDDFKANKSAMARAAFYLEWLRENTKAYDIDLKAMIADIVWDAHASTLRATRHLS